MLRERAKERLILNLYISLIGNQDHHISIYLPKIKEFLFIH